MSKLSYRELEEMVKDLQAKVEKGIIVKQNLIDTQHELDADLNRLQLLQHYSATALGATSLQAFGELTVEHLVQIFNLARVAFITLNQEGHGMVFSQFGMDGMTVSDFFCRTFSDLGPNDSMIIKSGHPLFEPVKEVGLKEAIVCMISDGGDVCSGMLIGGYTEEDLSYYEPLEPKINAAFALMTNKVGAVLENLRVNEQLRQEVEERKQAERALMASKADLQEAKDELEKRVEARTKDLSHTNELLEQEIEDRKRIEMQLAERAEDLARSNKDLEQFAYVASHDLKAPLRNIFSFVQLLEKHFGNSLNEDGREYMNFVFSGVNQLNRLIDDLLQYSRVNRSDTHFGQIELHEVIEAICQNLNSLIASREAVITCDPLPDIYASYSQMVQLFQNLISNAIKFTPANKKPRIHISSKLENNECIILVQDNGIGIKKNYHDKVFSIFQRLHPTEYDGTGIGLSICKKIVERHKGRIWFESDLGKGTSFYIAVPAQLEKIA